ncbi:MAG: DUF58 domain-containing protein [Clostridia bacterium]|nr:DUF58 domain-containing protein [Clostridia bacterium]
MPLLFIIVILVALAIQRYSVWRAQNCREIGYECRPSVRACEPGEAFLVYSTVSNRGHAPSPSLRVEEHFPMKLEVLEAEQYNVKVLTKEHRIYNSTVIIRGRQQVKRYLRASISERGEYCFSFADFNAGDFLGLHEYRFRRDNDARIVVYPPKIENDDLIKAFTNAIDEIAMRKQLLEDPISVNEYRDYTGREPMRQISWTQTAVRSKLIVKQFDPVWQYTLTIVLDTQFHGQFDSHHDRQEFCFSLVRTLCETLEKRLIGYRLITNATISNEPVRFSSSGGMGGSFSRILYALGSAGNGYVCSVEQLMREVCSDSDQRDRIILVSTNKDDQVRNAIEMAREYTGDEVVTLFADELMPPEEASDTDAEGDQAV